MSTLLKILAYPVILLANIINFLKSKKYDPEKVACPSCGYTGERSSNWKSCTIRFVRTAGPELGMIEHTCLRDYAVFYSETLVKPAKWLSPAADSKIAQMQKTIAEKKMRA